MTRTRRRWLGVSLVVVGLLVGHLGDPPTLGVRGWIGTIVLVNGVGLVLHWWPRSNTDTSEPQNLPITRVATRSGSDESSTGQLTAC